MRKPLFHSLVVLTILLLISPGYVSSASTSPASEISSPEKVYRPQLWNPDDPVGITVFNPNNEPLVLPEPHYPKTFEEVYGPGINELNVQDQIPPSSPLAPDVVQVGGNVTFQITYADGPGEGFNHPTLGPSRKNALAFAVDIWEQQLQGPASISLQVEMNPLGGTATECFAASGGAGIYSSGFTHAPISNTYYPEVLVEILSGSDPDTGSFDISIEYNSDVDNPALCGADFYYGTDGLPPGSDFDFVTITLHEITHGLGFIDSFNSAGQFGLGNPKNGIPVIYDRYLVNNSGVLLITLPISSTNVTKPVFWTGVIGRFAYNHDFLGTGGNSNVPLYAPSPYELGSSIAHLNEATFSGDWQLMTPVYGDAIHTPDSIVMGILQDIGHSLPNSRYVDCNGSGFEDGSSGNPFNTVGEGVTSAPTNGFVRILPGICAESLTITKVLTLIAPAGGVQIGQ